MKKGYKLYNSGEMDVKYSLVVGLDGIEMIDQEQES